MSSKSWPTRALNQKLNCPGNWPASYHNKAGGMTFADRHAEMHRWRGPRTTTLPTKSQLASNIDSPNNLDVAWLQERCTVRVK